MRPSSYSLGDSEDLPNLAQEGHQKSRKTLSFKNISLKWLNELTKLTILIATGNRRWKLDAVTKVMTSVGQFDRWLIQQGYISPSALTQQTIQRWLVVYHKYSQKSGMVLWLNILYKIQCISFKIENPKIKQPKSSHPKAISEKIKYELDLKLNTLEPSIYLALKLLESLGLRSNEIANLPLNCLKKREDIYQIRIATGKQNNRERARDIPQELIPLIQQQQEKVKNQFGDNFPWLFSNWEHNSGSRRWSYNKFKFFPEQLKRPNNKLNRILKNLIEFHDIKDENGQLARITTHDFRRTYATIADRMGKRPDQIQYGLRHLNLDMQDSYVNIQPQEQEKRVIRILVDKDGTVTTYKTDKDAEIIRLEWKLRQVENGICTRPHIMKDCEYDYVCLGCEFIRFSIEHLPQLLKIKQDNLDILNRCIKLGQSESRRGNSVRQLLKILEKIIIKLETKIKEENNNE